MFKKVLHINLEGIAELQSVAPLPMGLFNDAEPLVPVRDKVYLLDAVFGCLSLPAIESIVKRLAPDLVILGNGGCQNDLCYIFELKKQLQQELPEVRCVLGISSRPIDWEASGKHVYKVSNNKVHPDILLENRM